MYTIQLSKTFLFQAIQFRQTVLIQPTQLRIRIDLAYTQLNVKTVIFQAIQISVSTISMSKTVPFQTIQFSISTQFKCKQTFLKNICISSHSVLSNGSNSNNSVKCKCSFVYTLLNVKTVLFQEIRFSIITLFSSF